VAELRDKLMQYTYADTRQLVILVEDAATLIEQQGEAAFAAFGKKNSRWLNNKYYLFVYDIPGKCAFHPVEPSLIGQDMSNFRDIENRPVIQMITEVGKSPAPDSSGWVFYLWEDPARLFPFWKSSYVRKAITPQNKVYLVGSGSYNIKPEKKFVQQQVDKAAAEMRQLGGKAFIKKLKTQHDNFHFMNSYLAVMDANGNFLVDPNFPSLNIKRNLLKMFKLHGVNIGDTALKALKTKDQVWVCYVWPNEESGKLQRKLAYIKKVYSDNAIYYITMGFYPATPIWMK